MRLRMVLIVYLAMALFSAPALMAQTVELRGVVTDESGAIVPGAKVSVTGPAGPPHDVVTDREGAYRLSNVAEGTYTVRASAPDLASEATKIELKPGIHTLDLQVRIVTVSQQVTVVDQVALVTPEPANKASATVLGGKELDALSDNPDDLINELIAIAGPGAGPGGASICHFTMFVYVSHCCTDLRVVS